MKRWLTLAGPMCLTLVPCQVNADPLVPYTSSLSWEYECAVGDFSACVSLSAKLQYDPTPEFQVRSGGGIVDVQGSTSVTMSFANLQGSEPWLPDSGQWRLNSFSMEGLTSDFPESRDWSGSTSGDVMTDGSVQYWTGSEIQEGAGPWERYGIHDPERGPDLWVFGQNDNALYGCDHPPFDPTAHYIFTMGCGATLSISWAVPGRWSFNDDMLVRWYGYFGDPSSRGDRVGCVVAVDCVSYSVPEPPIWLIMATGLTGLGIIAGRRYRADGAVSF